MPHRKDMARALARGQSINLHSAWSWGYYWFSALPLVSSRNAKKYVTIACVTSWRHSSSLCKKTSFTMPLRLNNDGKRSKKKKGVKLESGNVTHFAQWINNETFLQPYTGVLAKQKLLVSIFNEKQKSHNLKQNVFKYESRKFTTTSPLYTASKVKHW